MPRLKERNLTKTDVHSNMQLEMEARKKHSLFGISTTYALSQRDKLYLNNISLVICFYVLFFEEMPIWETSRASQDNQEDIFELLKQLYEYRWYFDLCKYT